MDLTYQAILVSLALRHVPSVQIQRLNALPALLDKHYLPAILAAITVATPATEPQTTNACLASTDSTSQIRIPAHNVILNAENAKPQLITAQHARTLLFFVVQHVVMHLA